MKLMIASDLHGSAADAGRLLERLDESGAELLILLGDLYYHGPRNPLPDGYAPMEVAAMLNARKERLLAVRGNCDADVDLMISEFALTETAQLEADGKRLFFAHGDKFSPDALPNLPAGSLFFSGHTHVSGFLRRGEILCVNPGSVSLPKEGTEKGYAIFEDGAVSLFALDGAKIK